MPFLITKCSSQDDNFYVDLTLNSNSNLIEKLNELLISDRNKQKDQIDKITTNDSFQIGKIFSSFWSRIKYCFKDENFVYLILSILVLLMIILIAGLLILKYFKARKAKKLRKVEFKKKKNFSFDVIDLMGYRNSFKIFKWSNPDESNSISEEYQFENFSNNNSKPDQTSDAISDRLIYEVPYQYTYGEKSLNTGEYETRFQTFSTRKNHSFKSECKRVENSFNQETNPSIFKVDDGSCLENPYSPVLSTDSITDDSEPCVNILSTFQSAKNFSIYEEPSSFQTKIN